MYNGIGLSTVRGSATSGHVQKNLSHIQPQFFRNKLDANTGKQGRRDGSHGDTQSNAAVLEHNRKHAIEAEIFEFQEDLVDKGYSAEDIEKKVSEFRANLMSGNTGVKRSGHGKGVDKMDSHLTSRYKEEKNRQVANAFGIGNDFVPGSSFDPEAQEKRRRMREEEKKLEKEVI